MYELDPFLLLHAIQVAIVPVTITIPYPTCCGYSVLREHVHVGIMGMRLTMHVPLMLVLNESVSTRFALLCILHQEDLCVCMCVCVRVRVCVHVRVC